MLQNRYRTLIGTLPSRTSQWGIDTRFPNLLHSQRIQGFDFRCKAITAMPLLIDCAKNNTVIIG